MTRGWWQGWRALPLLFTAVMALSCATPTTTATARPTREPATVRVENRAVLDVNVYALRAGQRIRLGTVTAHSTSTFRVPATLVGSGMGVQFIADFIGSSRAPVSDEVTIWPGDEVQLIIPPA